MRLIYVEWVDSFSVGVPIWNPVEDVSQAANQRTICKSAGFMIEETREHVVVAGHLGHDEQQCGGHIIIPKVAIKKRRWLSK